MDGKTLTVPLGFNYLNLSNVFQLDHPIVEQIRILKSVKIISSHCFWGHRKLAEIIFESANVDFEGKDTFHGCSSLGIIYVINVGEWGLSYFKQKLIRAGLNKNVKVIHGYDKWYVIDLPFLFGEDNTHIADSL